MTTYALSVDDVCRYESGEMTPEEEVTFFADLIRTGVCWHLQGHYGRTAAAYIEAGTILPDGSLPPAGGVEAN